ncbi:hypothetical protein KIH41_06485 [Litoribacter ruber]|uniref:hypothetical protein n=1 Tax=Litoribacter ruber TaxID=702568 RepID=UPI001BDA842F|nr:hypothetical protein [Litoribacter ruber]MBT0810925.1 hypothetical protein [Litoribacter ruber]
MVYSFDPVLADCAGSYTPLPFNLADPVAFQAAGLGGQSFIRFHHSFIYASVYFGREEMKKWATKNTNLPVF